MNLVALADGIGRLEADGSVSELDLPHPDVTALLESEGADGGLSLARSAKVRRSTALDDASVGCMLAPAAVVWGVGLNYLSKQVATGRARPDTPVLFTKAPSAFCGFGAPIRIPTAAPHCVDYEGEIAVMIGAHLHCATPDAATRSVVGYLAANDVTARDVMRSSGNPTIAKSFPGFGQLGCAMACAAGPESLRAVPLVTVVDGEVRQRDDSSGMLLPVGDLVAMLSKFVVLRPGDLVLTGTPAGTGDETGRYLVAGNTVEVRVGDLPALVSTVAGSPVGLPETPAEVPA